MITKGEWFYIASTGEVLARPPKRRKLQRIAIVAADGDDEDVEADANGELIALSPKLAAMVRELSEWECSEAVHPKKTCGECTVCRARELAADLPEIPS